MLESEFHIPKADAASVNVNDNEYDIWNKNNMQHRKAIYLHSSYIKQIFISCGYAYNYCISLWWKTVKLGSK